MELIGALEQSAIGSDTDDTDDNIDITLKHFLLQFRYQPNHFVADGWQRSQVLDLQPDQYQSSANHKTSAGFRSTPSQVRLSKISQD